MDAEITPRPTEPQRRALIAAVSPVRERTNPAYASPWRRAGLAAPLPLTPLRAGREGVRA